MPLPIAASISKPCRGSELEAPTYKLRRDSASSRGESTASLDSIICTQSPIPRTGPSPPAAISTVQRLPFRGNATTRRRSLPLTRQQRAPRISAASAAAQAADLGDLFEYKLKDRVTIHKNESALVPILQVPVVAEKVSLWNSSQNSPRPLRALWLTNSSGLTLDGGSFSVIESETFAGEGLIDAAKPGEKRLLSYAVDLGLRVDARAESQPQRVTRVRIVRGVMIQTSEMRQQTSYTIRNDDISSRSLLIEHPLRPGWKLSDSSPTPEETTSNLYRFRQNIDPQASATFTVLESTPTETRYELTNLTNDQIVFFERQKSITPELEAALRKIIEEKAQIAALDAQISSQNDETKRIFSDQERLRENLKALKGSAEERALTQRYTQQLADQETRLDAIQRETAELLARRAQAQSTLDAMISSLVLDSTL
jgi:hypothetical protein